MPTGFGFQPLAQRKATHAGKLVDLGNQPKQQLMGRRGVFHGLFPIPKAWSGPMGRKNRREKVWRVSFTHPAAAAGSISSEAGAEKDYKSSASRKPRGLDRASGEFQ